MIFGGEQFCLSTLDCVLEVRVSDSKDSVFLKNTSAAVGIWTFTFQLKRLLNCDKLDSAGDINRWQTWLKVSMRGTHSPVRCSNEGLSFGNGGCYFGCNSKVSCNKERRHFTSCNPHVTQSYGLFFRFLENQDVKLQLTQLHISVVW